MGDIVLAPRPVIRLGLVWRLVTLFVDIARPYAQTFEFPICRDKSAGIDILPIERDFAMDNGTIVPAAESTFVAISFSVCPNLLAVTRLPE